MDVIPPSVESAVERFDSSFLTALVFVISFLSAVRFQLICLLETDNQNQDNETADIQLSAIPI
jgi:hypothetical protein